MNKFQIKKEKIPSLTLEDILDCGWERVEQTDKQRYIFQKDNYYLICNFNDSKIAVMRIFARDPVLITWLDDPENFRMIFRCPNKEYFQIVTSTL